MTLLLEMKENLRIIYAKYSVIVDAAVRFMLSFFTIILLDSTLGFSARFGHPAAAAAAALVCSILPYGAISLVIGIFLLAHIQAVSPELALLLAFFLVIVALLYCSFQPGDSYWLILTPISFLLHVPFAVPLLAGLSGSFFSAVPVSCGVVIYYVILYAKQNAGVLMNDASVDITQKFIQLIRAVVLNKEMAAFMAVCACGVLIVYLVRRLSTDYAWILAIALGLIGQLAAVFGCDFLFDITVPLTDTVPGLFFGAAIAGIYHFLFFTVDYSRTEYTQFEDDNYIYYVKAVPKLTVSRSDVKVQRINSPRRPRRVEEKDKSDG